MNDFYYITRVRIKRKTEEDPAYFGRGVADLLHGIEKYHSLNQAAKEMGMAYSKAWRIVGEAEQALGISFNLQNAEKWFQSDKRRGKNAGCL